MFAFETSVILVFTMFVCAVRAVIKEALWCQGHVSQNLTICLLEGVWFETVTEHPIGSLTTHSWCLGEWDPFTEGSGVDVTRSISLFHVNFINSKKKWEAWICKTKEKANQGKFPKEGAWERGSVGRKGKKRRKNLKSERRREVEWGEGGRRKWKKRDLDEPIVQIYSQPFCGMWWKIKVKIPALCATALWRSTRFFLESCCISGVCLIWRN